MSFNLEIISPSKVFMNDEVELVIFPGTEGDLGVLSNHMPIITTLRLGIIYIYKDKKVFKKFLVNGGIIEMSNNKCTLLTEDISSTDQKKDFSGDNEQIASKKLEILNREYYS